MGTVTQVAADHYTIKIDSGETYTVHFSANTRIVKQTAQGPRRARARVEAAVKAKAAAGNPPRPSNPPTSRWATPSAPWAR